MARSLETDPINQLEENLQCSVCLEALKDPRTLPCFHSFCKDCLEGVVKTCREKAAPDGGQIREFPCPDCRTMFTLEPDKHVADMPRNHFICNMVQVIAVLDRGTRVPCSHNCSQSSVARCVTCEKFLCRECLTDHNKYRGHNDHSVLTMEELSKPENQAKIKGKMYCNEHSGKTLKIYCETCDQLICKHCMDFKHVKQNHSCLLVKDVASNYKELLASNNKSMEDAFIEGNSFLQRLSQKTAGLDRDVENAKRHIVERKELMVKKVVEMLNQKAETLLKEVEGIHKSERAKLDNQTTETKLYVEKIKQSVQLSKKLVDQGTEEEIISSQKMMLDNANNLLTKRSEHLKAVAPVTKVRYIPGTSKEPLDDDNVTAIKNSLGKIVEVDVVDESPCSTRTNSVKPKARTAGEKNVVEKLSCVLFKNIKVSVYQGDITKEMADVIVNSAKEDLKHSAGVGEAIVKAGGKSIQDESDDIMKKRYNRLSPGEVVATNAGNLPCSMIVHAVGPRWAHYQNFQKDAAKNVLYAAVWNSLTVASQHGATSISMPAISSGIFGVPVPICAEVLFTAVASFAENAPTSNSLKDIRFVNIDKKTTQVFAQEIQKRFGASVKREIIEVSHSNNKEQSGGQKQSSYSLRS